MPALCRRDKPPRVPGLPPPCPWGLWAARESDTFLLGVETLPTGAQGPRRTAHLLCLHRRPKSAGLKWRGRGPGWGCRGRVPASCVGPGGHPLHQQPQLSRCLCGTPERTPKPSRSCKPRLTRGPGSCARLELSAVETRLFTSSPCWHGASDLLSNNSLSWPRGRGTPSPCLGTGRGGRSTREGCRHGFRAWKCPPDH